MQGMSRPEGYSSDRHEIAISRSGLVTKIAGLKGYNSKRRPKSRIQTCSAAQRARIAMEVLLDDVALPFGK